jgi:hypothetical protein
MHETSAYEITDADREMMRYDPAEHREFEGSRRLHLGHECNTPTYVLDGFAHAVYADRPATWPAKVSWRFPLITGEDRLAIRPRFTYIGDQAALERWYGCSRPDGKPWHFDDSFWMWEGTFRFAVEPHDPPPQVQGNRSRHDELSPVLNQYCRIIGIYSMQSENALDCRYAIAGAIVCGHGPAQTLRPAQPVAGRLPRLRDRRGPAQPIVSDQ